MASVQPSSRGHLSLTIVYAVTPTAPASTKIKRLGNRGPSINAAMPKIVRRAMQRRSTLPQWIVTSLPLGLPLAYRFAQLPA